MTAQEDKIAAIGDSIQKVIDSYLDQLGDDEEIDTADLAENIARHLTDDEQPPTAR